MWVLVVVGGDLGRPPGGDISQPPLLQRPQDITADESPEENNVDDPHDEHRRPENDQVDRTDTVIPDEHTVDDPREAQETARDESEKVHARVQTVEPVRERDRGHLEQLTRMQEYRVDFGQECDDVERNAPALCYVVEEHPCHLEASRKHRHSDSTTIQNKIIKHYNTN